MSEPCTRYLESMSAFIDGELPEAEVRALEAHLAACPDCRLALEEMRAGDEELRAATARRSDSRSEGEAVERVLARLRDEPAPEWAAARRRSRWNWSVTLRWSAGLAAAAAAVLLVMRLGPTPTAPIRTRAIPPSQQVAVPAPAAQAPSQQVGERSQEVAKAKSPARPPAMVAARDERAGTAAQVEKKTERTPAAAPKLAEEQTETEKPAPAEATKSVEPTEATPPTNAAQADQEKSAAGVPPSSAPAPAPAEPERYAARETREAPSARSAPSERGAASAERAPAPSPPPRDGSILGRVKSTLSGGTARTKDAPAGIYFNNSEAPPPWYMTVAESDTTVADRAWKTRLEDAEVEMMSLESAKLRGDERARRYHAIGDLWEWFGRTANDPIADVHALTCYRLAVRNDAQAAALDSTRVQRARAAVAGLSKVTPAYR